MDPDHLPVKAFMEIINVIIHVKNIRIADTCAKRSAKGRTITGEFSGLSMKDAKAME